MAAKVYTLPGIGPVQLYKRRGNRSVRLSITARGGVKVTLPVWVPYKEALRFVRTKQYWIIDHLPERKPSLAPGQRIGKAHRLVFVPSASRVTISGRVVGTEIRISYPDTLTKIDPAVQEAAEATAVRALRQQAKKLLPHRLKVLAGQYGFTYRSVTIKQLSSRWGSCSSHGDITLNLYLMQLPWELIDYVLAHELIHTQVLNHGADFWADFERCLPNAKELRKELRKHQPVLSPIVRDFVTA